VAEARSAASEGANRNAAAVHDAGGVGVLTALLCRRPLAGVPFAAVDALGFCVELNAARDADSTRAAVMALVGLLSPALYDKADISILRAACMALRGVCAASAASQAELQTAAAMDALLGLLAAAHAAGTNQAEQASFADPVFLVLQFAQSHPHFSTAFGAAGGMEALCRLLPGAAANMLWFQTKDSKRNAERVRDCGGIAALARTVRESAEDADADTDACLYATGALMTLANNDSLTACIADWARHKPDCRRPAQQADAAP
jgi:hypothetical protein